jgi:hypothetical protein
VPHLLPVFHFLFHTHSHALQNFFKQIPFMPEEPDAIKPYTVAFEAATGNSSAGLTVRLGTFSDILKHENSSVRVMALDKLLAVLRSKRDQTRRMALLGEDVDASLKHLMEVVLQGCRDPERYARIKFGAVYGELGAIDPARLRAVVADSPSSSSNPNHAVTATIAPVQGQGPPKPTRSDSNLDTASELAAALDKPPEEVTYDIISKYLIRAFRSAPDLQLQDAAAYSIQELLKMRHCNAKMLSYKHNKALQPKEEAALAFWTKFTAEEQLLITPLLSSRYRSMGTSTAPSTKPVYHEKVRVCLCSEPARLLNVRSYVLLPFYAGIDISVSLLDRHVDHTTGAASA